MVKYIIKPSVDGKFTVAIIARNGEPIFSSETIDKKKNAEKVIFSTIAGHRPMERTTFKVFDTIERVVRTYGFNEWGVWRGPIATRKFTKKETETYVRTTA